MAENVHYYPVYSTGDSVDISPYGVESRRHTVTDSDIAAVIDPDTSTILAVLTKRGADAPYILSEEPSDYISRGLHVITFRTRTNGNYKGLQEKFNGMYSAIDLKMNRPAPTYVRHK